MKKILNSIDTLNTVGKYSSIMETENGKFTLNERKEWLKLKYPDAQLKTNIIYVLSNPKMIVARTELFVNDRLLSTGTGTSMYESIPLNADVLKAKERAENRYFLYSVTAEPSSNCGLNTKEFTVVPFLVIMAE